MAFTMRSPPPTTTCQSLQKMTFDRLEYDIGVHSKIFKANDLYDKYIVLGLGARLSQPPSSGTNRTFAQAIS